MKRRLLMAMWSMMAATGCFAQLTLEQCLAKADANYPLIKRYGLVENMKTIELSDIDKQWLPSINLYAQGTLQNNVAEFPSALTDILDQMGREVSGLGKAQYRIGADASQTIWDGGASRAKREAARSKSLEQESELDVAMYGMHERVISLFFAALLTSEQLKQQEAAITLLDANLSKMEAMLHDGAAMKSDVDNIKAQLLTARQKLTEAKYALGSYRNALSGFIGENIDGMTLVKPSAALPDNFSSNRPELKLYDRQINANNAKTAEINASLMPKLGLFAQAYYGYPGLNNFESMMKRDLSFNVLAGVRATWSLSPSYTKGNSLHKIRLANEAIESERETFLFNSDIKLATQKEEIEGIRKVMETDQEIITLRTDVRRAAEAQLDNGVIDTFTLLAKITDETQARLTAAYHEIKLLNAIHQLKYTINQ